MASPAAGMKLAVTALSASIVSVQVVAVPLHEPPHPLNREFCVSAAVSVTCSPPPYVFEHELPQVIPDGALVTEPSPPPVRETARVHVWAGVHFSVSARVARSKSSVVVPASGRPTRQGNPSS